MEGGAKGPPGQSPFDKIKERKSPFSPKPFDFTQWTQTDAYKRRNPSYPDGFQPSAVRQIFKSTSFDIPSNSSSTITVGQQLNELSKVDNRVLIETGFSASAQCKSLGISNTECFLCGFSLNDTRIPHEKATDFGYPQCEHLLPAGAALFYFGLVDTTDEGKRNVAVYKSNYLYAHNGCNQEKGSRLFLSLDTRSYTSTRAPILFENVKKYLDDLYTYNTVIQSIVPNKDEWINQSIIRISGVYTPLSEKLAEMSKIRMLSGVAKYIENIDLLYNKLKGVIKTKDQYQSRDEGAHNLLLLSRKGGRRKTFKRKNNGVSGKSKKQTYRATTNARRKRRTSN